MFGYLSQATCTQCGGPFRHCADGRATTYEACAVARCTDCGMEHVFRMRLEPLQVLLREHVA